MFCTNVANYTGIQTQFKRYLNIRSSVTFWIQLVSTRVHGALSGLPHPSSALLFWGRVVVRLFLSVAHLWTLYHPSCVF